MGGEQYVYSEGDAAWFATFLARCEKQSKGYIGISLTNFTTSTVCAIAAGSVVEIDGAMFHFAAEASVSGTIATGLNYIICSVTGTTAEPYWSQTVASTYDTAKQGWYTAAERYVAGCASDGTKYENKWVYDYGRQNISGPKIGAFQRETAGLQTITGIGFRPSILLFLATDDVNTNHNWSVGFTNAVSSMSIYTGQDAAITDNAPDYSIVVLRSGISYLRGKITTMSNDGFTIDWTLVSSVTANIIYLAMP